MFKCIACRWRPLLPALAVWAALAAITLISVAESVHPMPASAVAVVAALTALKVGLVMFSYMELDQAPLWLKAAGLAWIVIIFNVVGVLLVCPQWLIDT